MLPAQASGSWSLGLWLAAWLTVDALAGVELLRRWPPAPGSTSPWPWRSAPVLLFLWEVVTVGFGVPRGADAQPIGDRQPVRGLAADLVGRLRPDVPQRGARRLGAWAVPLASSWRSWPTAVPFLRRGLLPLGNFVAALPIIGIAPIMVMWFGFDWQSKAAVVVVMTFFPMLVNTVAGLEAAGRLELDLMRSYGAGWLVTLRQAAATGGDAVHLQRAQDQLDPGADRRHRRRVLRHAHVGMGFRISTEVGRMSLDMVWAEILVAALAGSAFYGALALLERAVTFWHPSYRGT